MLVAHIVDNGFVLPPAPAGPERTVDGQFRLLYVEGINQQLQYFRVHVANAADSSAQREVVLVCTHHPALGDETVSSNIAALSMHFPEQVIALLRKDGPGWASVSCAHENSEVLVAAATATVKTSCGWDESSPIVVEVDTHPFDVVMEFRETRWFARVRPSGSITSPRR